MSTIINNEGKEVLTAFHDIHAYSHRPNIFGDGIACIDVWDFSKANLNEENRIRAITQVASICYQNPKALESASLYKRLAAESIGLPSSSFEFVPVLLNPWNDVAKKILVDQRSNVRKFGEWISFEDPETGNTREALLTNYRAMCYDYEKALADIVSYFDNLPRTQDNELQLKHHIEYIEDMYLKFFNTEEECAIIKEHFKVFLFNVDMPTRSQMVRHRVNWQELCISGDSMITTLQGKRSIKELYENQFRKSPNKLPKVKTYDFNEKRLVWTEIKEVFSTGKKEVYEVVLQTGRNKNKLKIRSTENHKFYTCDGWKELKDIKIGDFIATNGIHILDNNDECIRITKEMIHNKINKKEYAELYNISELILIRKLQKINMIYSDIDFRITNYHLKEWLLEHKEKMINEGKNHKDFAKEYDINLNTLNKWFRKFNINYTKDELAKTKKDAWNKGLIGENSHSFGREFNVETKQKIGEGLAKPLGETALGFSFRVRSYWQADFRKTKILENFSFCCARCKTSDISDIELDHIKPVRLYPSLAMVESNIQPLCKKCHIEKSTEDTKLDDHTYNFNFVEGINLIGVEDTFDIEVDHPDHNYIANGIIVHNSRRYVSGKRVQFNFYISEGMKKVVGDQVTTEASGKKVNIHTTTEDVINICVEQYFAALEQGVKPQEARRIIPQAAYTKIWGAFQPSQLQNFFDLRLDEHAQWEIRKVAEAMFGALESYKNFPKMTAEQEKEASKRLQDLADGKVTLMTREEINSLLDAADEVEPNNILTTEEINKLSKTAVKFLTGVDMVPEDEVSLDDAFDLLKG